MALVWSEVFKFLAISFRGSYVLGLRLGVKGYVGSDIASETNFITSEILGFWLFELGRRLN